MKPTKPRLKGKGKGKGNLSALDPAGGHLLAVERYFDILEGPSNTKGGGR